MNAVIKVGGKQYFVKENDEIYVEKLNAKEGEKVLVKIANVKEGDNYAPTN